MVVLVSHKLVIEKALHYFEAYIVIGCSIYIYLNYVMCYSWKIETPATSWYDDYKDWITSDCCR